MVLRISHLVFCCPLLVSSGLDRQGQLVRLVQRPIRVRQVLLVLQEPRVPWVFLVHRALRERRVLMVLRERRVLKEFLV